jgi:hypothetical protein
MSPQSYLADTPNRKVLVAVELLDPVSLDLVHRGVAVSAQGLNNSPVISGSGRFVWLEEGTSWPTLITVTPLGGAPYASQVAAPPPRPADLEKALPDVRLTRITLRPIASYPFDDGLTVIRGRLFQNDQQNAPPVVGARVQLAWHDAQSDAWAPPPPQPENVVDNAPTTPSPTQVETDANGAFVVFLRLNPPKNADPDLANGLLSVRLQFTQGRAQPVTYATLPTFPFMTGATAPVAAAPANTIPTGRVPEGHLLDHEVIVNMTQLQRL